MSTMQDVETEEIETEATRYEALTDSAIPSQDDKSYTELNSDAWNEIFPLRKPLLHPPPAFIETENSEKPRNVSTDISNCGSEKTPIHASNKGDVNDEMGYLEPNDKYLEIIYHCNNAKENFDFDATDSGNPADSNQKKSCAIYVSQESECLHDYDYVQDGGIYPLKKLNENKSSGDMTSHRSLPVVPQAIYEPLVNTTKNVSGKKQLPRKRCLLIVGSCLGLILLTAAVIVGIVLGLFNNARGDVLVLDAIQGDGYVSGITVLDSQMFVVRYKLSPSLIYVYNANNFTFVRYININGSSALRAIVASPKENCLYISDTVLNVVYRYNLSNTAVTQWRVSGKCYGLSLTNTGNILVALRNTSQIQEYTPRGILVRVIRLSISIDIFIPWQSVQLSNGNFVINPGNTGSIHQVCAVDVNGSAIFCYGSSQGSGDRQLSKPGQLAVDVQDNVYAADTGNNRIVLLSPTLTFLSYIAIPGYTLNNPWALHLDTINRRIYIGEWTNSGRLFAVAV